MNEKETEKVCGNCKHYFQHYGFSGGRFIKIEFGHCKTLKSKTVFKRGMENNPACKNWESAERTKEEKSESIKKRIINLVNSLDQLANYIKDE